LKAGFGSRIKSPTFSISTMERSNFNLLGMEEELSLVHMRLTRVYVENLDYREFIPRFDRPETFFYLDPPYYGCENYYGDGIFCREDFQKLRDLLSAVRGKFILSINDTPEIRSLFKGFKVAKEKTIYSATVAAKKRVVELLISNF
jgi:DNA adenine methylase